jgi:hypothetical protein
MPEDAGVKNAQSLKAIALSRPLHASKFQRSGDLKGQEEDLEEYGLTCRYLRMTIPRC